MIIEYFRAGGTYRAQMGDGAFPFTLACNECVWLVPGTWEEGE